MYYFASHHPFSLLSSHFRFKHHNQPQALPQENYAGAARKKSRLFPYRPTTALAYGIYSTALYEWPYCNDTSSMFDILLICAAFFSTADRSEYASATMPGCLDAFPQYRCDGQGGDAIANLFSSLTLITAVTTPALIPLAAPS
jgi:hypothetical protein